MTEGPSSPILVSQRPSRRDLRNWAESNDLALAWTAAFAVGFLAIVASALAADADGLVQQLVPLGAMVIYVVYAVRRAHHNRARVADSAYFLGFLWTLVTLTATVLDKREDLAPTDLIQVFAIALSTTGMGLFLRTLLIQFHRTAGDQEHEASDLVDVKLKAFISALEEGQRNVTDFTAAMARGQTEQVARVRQDTLDALAAFNGQVTSASQQLTRAIETNIRSMQDGVRLMTDLRNEMVESVKTRSAQMTRYTNKVTEQLDEVSRAVGTSGRELTTAIDLAADGILNAPLPHKALERKFDEVGELLVNATVKHQEVLNRSTSILIERIDELSKAVLTLPGGDTLTQSIAGLTTILGSLATATARTTEGVQALARQADSAHTLFASLSSAAGRIEDHSSRVAATLTSAHADAERVSASARSAADQMNQSVADAANASREIVDFVSRRISEMTR